MDENRLQFGVGVLVIAAIGIGIILTFLFGAVPRVLTGEIKVFVAFPNAEGITTNSPVMLRGVEIGRVIEKQLVKDSVRLTLGIDSTYQDNLTYEYLPRIKTGNLITGESKLEFVKGTEAELVSIHKENLANVRDEPFQDQDFLDYGKKNSDPFNLLLSLEDELRETLGSIRGASSSLQTVGDEARGLVSDARGVVGNANTQVDGVGEDARLAIKELQRAIRAVNEILDDETLQANVQEAVANLPGVVKQAETALRSTTKTLESFDKVGQQFERVGAEAEKTVQNVDQTIDTVRDTVQSVQGGVKSAERAIKNIETITEPIAANSDQIVTDALATLQGLQRTLRQVEVFGATLNNSDGTVKRLLEDDELYYNIKRTVENIEMTTAKLRPILDDVRIFSDKIARDPRELGVRGALGKRPSGLGLK